MILKQQYTNVFLKGKILFFFLILLQATLVKASHIAGGDISYKPLGGNQYQVTLNLFRDCSGITVGTSETVSINSNCGLSTSITVNLTNPGGTEVSQLCPTQLPNSTCASGTQPGMQHYIYTGVYTFASMCDSITFSWSSCCRNTSVNVPSSSGDNMYLSAVLYGSSFPVNNSPEFTAQPIPYVCANQPVTYNYGVVEADGDSLRFKLIAAKTGATTNVTYGAGYSATAPLAGITINANTGQIAFTPTVLGNFIVTIGVYEYTTTGVLKGFTMRDIQFVVQSCSNSQPTPTAGVITSLTGSAIQTGNYSLRMCEGNSFTFTASFNDPDGSDVLTLTSNITSALPGSTISFSGTNPRVATISWTATAGSAGSTNIFTISVEDDACPIPGIQTMVYDIQVVQATTAGPDQAYCPSGGGVQLQANGGTTFTWSPSTGLSCSNCANPVATPAVTTTYIVTSNLTGSCKNKDTVIVRVVPDFNLSVTPATSTICQNGGVTLTATPSIAGTYTYSWSPATGLSGTTVQNPLAQPLSTSTYTVTATSSQGCRRGGSAIVNVSGVAPLVRITAGDTTLCAGESTTLTSTVYNLPLSCGVPTSTCASPTTYTVGAGTLSTTGPTPYKGFYHDGRIQILYTKADLNAAGIIGGVIKNLAFNIATKSSTIAYTGYTIKMGCTSAASLTTTFTGSLTTVYGPSNVTPAVGWNSYTLSGNGYEWDGNSNIIVEVCFNNASYTSSDAVFYTNTSYTSVVYADMDASPTGGCDLAGEYTSTQRPDIRFGVCSLPGTFTYAWSPAAGLSSTTVANPVATPATTTTYVLNVTNTATGCTGARSIVIYVGGATFTLTPSATANICAGSSTTINVNPNIAGSFTYTWSPASGLSSSTIKNPVASPSGTTTYSVTASNGGAGCTKTSAVIVNVRNRPTVTITGDTLLCLGESTTFATTTLITSASCAVPSSSCTAATNTVQIGTGTLTSSSVTPLRGGYEDGRIQMLYTKAELNAAGIYGGVIKTLALKVGTVNSSAAYSGFTVKVGCSSLSSAGTNFVSGLTTVYSVANHNPTANSWNTYTLSGNGYEWDGVSNIIVEVCFDNNNWTSSDAVEYTTTAFTSVTYAEMDGGSGCTLVGEYTSTSRPNMRFGFCTPAASVTYAWSPSTYLSSTTVANPTATPTTAGTITYTLSVTDIATGCVTVKRKIVMTGAAYTLAMSPTTSICNGAATTITATPSIAGTYSYSWTPSTGISSGATSASAIVAPTSTITYTVTSQSSGGCERTGTVIVNVTPGSLTTSATTSSATICKGSSANLTGSATSTPTSCGTIACSNAPTYYIVGTGTSSTTTYGSLYGVSGNNSTAISMRRQFHYTKAEINASGLATGGVITSIGWNVVTAGTAISGYTVKIGCVTPMTAFANGTFLTGLTQVYSGTVTPVAGWTTINFTTPYSWDGTSDLVVEVCYDTRQSVTPSSVTYTSLTGNRIIYYNSAGGVSGSCSQASGSNDYWRANIRLGVCIPSVTATYSWSPTTGLSNPSITNPVATPTATTTYTFTAVDGTGCIDTSSVIVNVNRVDAGPDISICSGSNTGLSATYIGTTGLIAPASCGTSTVCAGTLGNNVFTVGTGTLTTNSSTPFLGFYHDGRIQILYTKADLNAAGLYGGTIKSLAFNIATKGSTIPYSGFTIKMACVSTTALSTTFEAATFSTVYGPSAYTTVANSWNTFTLAGNGYSWDGISNLLVEVCFDNTSYTNDDYVTYTTTTYTSVAYDEMDSGTGCTMTTPSTSTARPNIRFNVCQDQVNPTYSWSPAASISAGATTATPTTTNLTSTVNYIVTVTANSCTLKDTVAVTIAAPSALTWTGATSTNWFTASNWNLNCLPECATSVTIPTGVPNYPSIGAAGAACGNITVSSGASLTMTAAGTLSVCGDWLNNGTQTINPAATVIFNNASVNQGIDGTVTGTNKFGNLTVTKTGGQVNFLQNIDIGGTLLTSNATSVINTNGKYIRVAGNFTNNAGGTTFTNVGTTTGTLEFNGTTAQTYTPGGALTLNNVVMNHTGTGVTLAGHMSLGTAGTLTLNLGKIITGATYLVTANNMATTSVTTGNVSSYVEGFLRRYINPTGSYDFPVGNSAKGYQRANVNFTTATAITYLTADFQSYATVPGPLGSSECSITYNYNALDNGFWNIEANTANNNTGVYTMTLYNRAYTNATTTNGWTVMSRHNGSGTWALVNGDGSNGLCVGSPVTGVVRQNMKGFSKFGTAQSTNVLPIDLLSFTGTNHGEHNLLEWVTASEMNNLYYAIERMNNASEFVEIGRVEGSGTISTQQYYSYKDYSFENKVNYYRLKQVDFDGKQNIEGIVSIDNRIWKSSKLQLFPNPANTMLFLSFTSDWADNADLEIINDAGQVVMKSSESFRKDMPVKLEIGSLANGLYVVKITNPETGSFEISRFMKTQ